ncbi:MAG: glycosyltransferase family 2 protein, partial [Anaerolineales bacterium]|nr:glycosyltransferase family 2 protein [Anaerolineales bacterium]MDW8277137.1 glycosyltransferase family 2 protein [Anaerolineales bacterium]
SWMRRYGAWQAGEEKASASTEEPTCLEFISLEALLSPVLQEKLATSAEYLLFATAPLRVADDAVSEFARAVERYPNADLLYSDGDWLDTRGRRFNPWFKPAFALDSLRAQNYIVPLFAVRKSLGDSLGWFDPAAGSAWAEDLIWRVLEHAREVVHIPKVLYHQTAPRPVTPEDEQRALQKHLERVGWPAEIAPGPASHTFHLRYRLHQQPLISIIIPNHDFAGELRRCIRSILQKSTYPHFEILILENNSQETETLRLYEQLQAQDARVRVLEYHHRPFNYAEINNFGAFQARGEVLLFLNNDTEVITPDWLERMLEYAQRPDVGAVGAKLYYPENLIQHVGVIIGLLGVASHHFVNYSRNHVGYHFNTLLPQNFSAVTAACLMTRSRVFHEVGGFEQAYRLAYNDIDLCLKIRERGYAVVWTPYAELYHHESLTRGYDSNTVMLERLHRERQTFVTRWQSLLREGDPYYNPNLALDRGYYSLRPGRYDVTARAMPGLGQLLVKSAKDDGPENV